MKIKEFCKGYSNRIDKLKDDYLKENLKITTYLPFLRKDAIATVLVDRSTYKFESYTKEDGTIGSKKTDEIKVNSVAQYLLFCRVVIENYTNLEVETDSFYEEYDALKQCGLLDKLMVGSENVPPMIPADEIGELRMLIDMKQKDELTNKCEIHNFISEQVTRFGELAGVLLNPVFDKISEQLENISDEDVEKIRGKANDFLEVVK